MGQIITMIYTCKSMKDNTLITGGNKFDDETRDSKLVKALYLLAKQVLCCHIGCQWQHLSIVSCCL